MCQEYNGWSNYQTWVTSLWMDNDEGSYSYWVEQAEDAESVRDLADRMQSEHETAMYDLVGVTGVFSDLLGHAVEMVDWYEIAQHYFEEYHEEENDSDNE